MDLDDNLNQVKTQNSHESVKKSLRFRWITTCRFTGIKIPCPTVDLSVQIESNYTINAVPQKSINDKTTAKNATCLILPINSVTSVLHWVVSDIFPRKSHRVSFTFQSHCFFFFPFFCRRNLKFKCIHLLQINFTLDIADTESFNFDFGSSYMSCIAQLLELYISYFLNLQGVLKITSILLLWKISHFL